MKTMQLSTFLENLANPSCAEQKKSVCFVGDKELAPVLFFALVREQLKQQGITGTTLDVSAMPIAHTYTALGTSFLGESACYWLKNISDLDTKTQTTFLAYLQEYAGPHQLFCFLPLQDVQISSFSSAWQVIELPLMLDQVLFARMTICFGKPLSAKSKQLSARLWAKHKTIALETACLLMHYCAVLGAQDDVRAHHYLDALIDAKASLFTLSGYLFAKQPEPFFTYWKTIADEYQAVFWISFWTEQLWRAHYVIKCMNAKQPLEAKKIGYRLPFSFLQRDYKRVSLAELQRAHQFLYEADFQLKNGASEFCLDLFYTKFLTGAFARAD